MEFIAYPKTPRLFRDIVITEKIDGTNAGVQIQRVDDTYLGDADLVALSSDDGTDALYTVVAQSRKRLIRVGDDNFGFAAWVRANSVSLVQVLGEGVHFGEWWGSGIQSGYGLDKGEKRFSLFNVRRWKDADLSSVPGLGVVPVLYEGPFMQEVIMSCVDDLRQQGSVAARFMKAEGVIVFHTASGQVYKVLCENDEIPKGLVA